VTTGRRMAASLDRTTLDTGTTAASANTLISAG
jgi:hypothetical protein